MQQSLDPGTQASLDAGYGARSPEWPRVEQEHLQIEPTCRVCGSTNGRNVHHIMPFHICRALGRPELELDQRNLVTLCEGTISHHLLIGHLDDWQSYNPDVTTDVTGPFRRWTDNQQIRADPQWNLKAQNRPLALRDWNDQQIADFKLRMDTLYPKQEVAAVVSAQVQITTPDGTTTTTTVETQAPTADGATTTTTTTTTTVNAPVSSPDSTSGSANVGG